MVVRRKYSLPGCTLIVEGLDDPNGSSSPNGSGRSPLSVLVSAECHVVGKPDALSGGKEFLDELTAAINDYTQSFLGMGKVAVESPKSWVTLTPLEGGLHRLNLRSPETSGGDPLQLDLTTLQLFDVVDVVDQLLSDRRTLPDRQLNLLPRNRRQAKNEEPVSQRAAPLALGLSSLVVAALALSPLPVPEVDPPREGVMESEEVSNTTTPTANDAPPEGSRGNTGINTAELAATVPTIDDPNLLAALRYKLHYELDQAWTTSPSFNDDLVYRVSVGQDGAIVGYRAEGDRAREFEDEIPLPNLLYLPVSGGSAEVESLAEYKVVFRPNGVLQVSPWDGYPSTPGRTPRITDVATIDRLIFDVRDALYDEWDTTPVFDRNLDYRLAVTEDGSITQYEPLSGAASIYFGELPINPLYNPAAGIEIQDDRVTLVPVAEFRVVFTPGGTIQIGPWDGRR
ncbi:DUF4335 domain-containing protein [Geitlerinema sp. P-1104]|uniref:DUF4335 domain-containing protein n=1 Tax=Geitlerinema sp. P-1104 TaxID=2546230 RepID=UPI0014770D3E|nr:DUF4335 domain-containing protein [Geitlerinema sp. P-1104]NMG58454.1 DUF4335 domain-containing protein [Geitlerinema sp. P-1104]